MAYSTAVTGMVVGIFFGVIGFFLTLTVVGAIVGIPMIVGSILLSGVCLKPYLEQGPTGTYKPKPVKGSVDDEWRKHL